MTKYSEEELIKELQRVSEEYCQGDSPTVEDMKKYGNISYATFSNRFGSWNHALEFSGYSKNGVGRGNSITQQEIIRDIKSVSREVGGPPTYSQYQEYGDFSFPTVRKRFNSWWNALSESGFEEYRYKEYSEQSNSRTNNEYISEFERVGEKINKVPTQKDIKLHSKYSLSSYKYNFKSWKKIIEKSKFSLKNGRNGIEISNEEALDELKKTVSRIGIDNSTRDIMSECKFSRTVYARKFGTINKALLEIGYEPLVRRDNPGKEQLIKDIKGIYRCYCDKDETPGQKIYHKKAKYSRNWVRNEFGSWNNAVEKAGFEANEKIKSGWSALKGEDHPLWKGGVNRLKYYGASWCKRRENVRKRDGNNCRVCGVNTKEKYDLKPDVHHITPVRYWNVEEEHQQMNHSRNLISLCKACHKPLEGKFKGRNHKEFEKLAKDYLNIECGESQEVKESLFDY